MDKDLLKGIKHGTGILLVFLVAFSVYAVGFHQTSEIVPGMFQGDYSFNGSVNVKENFTTNKHLKVKGNLDMTNNSINNVTNFPRVIKTCSVSHSGNDQDNPCGNFQQKRGCYYNLYARVGNSTGQGEFYSTWEASGGSANGEMSITTHENEGNSVDGKVVLVEFCP